MPLQYDINNSDMELEFAVHVLVGFGETPEDDLYGSFDAIALLFLLSVSTHDLSG